MRGSTPGPRPFKAIKIRKILDGQGYQEQVLAAKLKITKSALSRKLNGSRPWGLEEMERAAKFLGLRVNEVFPPEEYK